MKDFWGAFALYLLGPIWIVGRLTRDWFQDLPSKLGVLLALAVWFGLVVVAAYFLGSFILGRLA